MDKIDYANERCDVFFYSIASLIDGLIGVISLGRFDSHIKLEFVFDPDVDEMDSRDKAKTLIRAIKSELYALKVQL